jgi:hypothetical protein
MKRIRFVEDVLPHLIAVGVFLVATIIFFKPVFLDNRTLVQPDIQQWEGSAKELRDFRNETGEEGLWAGTMFSGMPAYLINVEWGNTPVLVLKQVLSFFLPHPVSNIYLAFLSYYILLLCFKVRPYLAIAGALAFGLSTYMMIGLSAGHNARIGAIAFMPMVVGGVHLLFRGKFILGLGVTTAALALHLRENHLQISYYMAMILGVYAVIQFIEAVREKRIPVFFKSAGMAVVAAVIAVGTFLGPLWAITEYTNYSIRGKSELQITTLPKEETAALNRTYAFTYSNGILEPITLFIPNFYGGTSANFLVSDRDSETYNALVRIGNQETANQLANYTGAYWGPQSFSSPYYGGAIVFFAFVLGIAFAPKKYVWWLVSLSVFGVMLSWGRFFPSFNYFLFDYLPVYNKFRSMTFALIIPLFCMPLLGFIGLEQIWSRNHDKDTRKRLWIVLAGSAGLCLLIIILGSTMSFLRQEEQQLPAWFTNALADDRQSLLNSDAIRSMMFMVAVFVLIFFQVHKKFSPAAVYAFIIIMMYADLVSVNKRYQREENYRRSRASAIAMTEADQEILKDKSNYRVYNIQDPFNDARTSYFHQSIGGYHGAKMRRYQDLIDSCIMRETNRLFQDAQTGALQFEAYPVLNMLNVKYIVYGAQRNNIFANPEANGSAWFVSQVRKVDNPTEELDAVCKADSKTQAIIDQSKFPLTDEPISSDGTIRLTERKPNQIRYESSNAGKGVAVFSEIFYEKGWRAFIDNAEVPIIRANYVLRALQVPAGNHSIEFRFEPKAYYTGNSVTAASSWLMILILLGSLGYSLRRQETES